MADARRRLDELGLAVDHAEHVLLGAHLHASAGADAGVLVDARVQRHRLVARRPRSERAVDRLVALLSRPGRAEIPRPARPATAAPTTTAASVIGSMSGSSYLAPSICGRSSTVDAAGSRDTGQHVTPGSAQATAATGRRLRFARRPTWCCRRRVTRCSWPKRRHSPGCRATRASTRRRPLGNGDRLGGHGVDAAHARLFAAQAVRALSRGAAVELAQLHIFLGLQGALLVTFHSLHLRRWRASRADHRARPPSSWRARASFGRYLYLVAFPRDDGERLSAREVEAELATLQPIVAGAQAATPRSPRRSRRTRARRRDRRA